MPRGPIKLKNYGIYVKLTGEELKLARAKDPKCDGFSLSMYIQCKTDKVASACVGEYISIGRLSSGKEYQVRRLSA